MLTKLCHIERKIGIFLPILHVYSDLFRKVRNWLSPPIPLVSKIRNLQRQLFTRFVPNLSQFWCSVVNSVFFGSNIGNFENNSKNLNKSNKNPKKISKKIFKNQSEKNQKRILKNQKTSNNCQKNKQISKITFFQTKIWKISNFKDDPKKL